MLIIEKLEGLLIMVKENRNEIQFISLIEPGDDREYNSI